MPSITDVCGKWKSYGYRTRRTPQTRQFEASPATYLPVSFSEMVKSHCLRFFGHVAQAAPEEDQHCVKAAELRPPADLNRNTHNAPTASHVKTALLTHVGSDNWSFLLCSLLSNFVTFCRCRWSSGTVLGRGEYRVCVVWLWERVPRYWLPTCVSTTHRWCHIQCTSPTMPRICHQMQGLWSAIRD